MPNFAARWQGLQAEQEVFNARHTLPHVVESADPLTRHCCWPCIAFLQLAGQQRLQTSQARLDYHKMPLLYRRF